MTRRRSTLAIAPSILGYLQIIVPKLKRARAGALGLIKQRDTLDGAIGPVTVEESFGVDIGNAIYLYHEFPIINLVETWPTTTILLRKSTMCGDTNRRADGRTGTVCWNIGLSLNCFGRGNGVEVRPGAEIKLRECVGVMP